MKLELDLIPFKDMPPEWKDGRTCLAFDKYKGWRVVRFDERYGWVYFERGDHPLADEDDFIREDLDDIAEIASMKDHD